jgi:hypothetical protein
MGLIDSRLTTVLTSTTHFPDTGTVQLKTVTNTKGNPTNTWADVAKLIDIACAIAADTAGEVRLPAFADRTHLALLAGDHRTIEPAIHRFVSSGVNYDILGVEHDSQSITTKLSLREVLL